MHAILFAVLSWFGKELVLRAFLSLGIFAISAVVMGEFVDAIHDAINFQVNSLSGVFAQALAVSGLLDAIAIMLGAYTTAIAIRALKKMKPQ